MRIHHTLAGRGLALAALLTIGLASTRSVSAASSFDFNLSFSESMLAALATGDTELQETVKHYEGWDSAIARIRKRNMPFIELTNTSDTPISLTQFQMTIAKPEFEFEDDILGGYAVVGTTTPGVALTSSSPDNGSTIIVNFTNGLAQGETVRFQVDIDVDAAYPDEYPYPDYRMVFFDVNAAASDESDNSVLTVSFSNNDSIVQTLPDFEQSSTVFLNGGPIRSYREMDGVEMFGIPGQIPEPSAAMLALAVGGGALARRSRGA